jgi:DNA replication protein DnaC
MEHDNLALMLNRLKLTAIRDQIDSLVDETARRELTIREALSFFCEREIARKDERRIEMSIGLARFPFVRDLDGFDFAAQPSIDKRQIREIAGGRFIANAEVVLLMGPLASARRTSRWRSAARRS